MLTLASMPLLAPAPCPVQSFAISLAASLGLFSTQLVPWPQPPWQKSPSRPWREIMIVQAHPCVKPGLVALDVSDLSAGSRPVALVQPSPACPCGAPPAFTGRLRNLVDFVCLRSLPVQSTGHWTISAFRFHWKLNLGGDAHRHCR